jgi:purine-nucleoside phosphorylase
MLHLTSSHYLIYSTELIDKYNVEDATEILLKGGSAGSLGLTSNIDWFNSVRIGDHVVVLSC